MLMLVKPGLTNQSIENLAFEIFEILQIDLRIF